MYEAFFGFSQRPFAAAPSANRYFPASSCDAARATLGRCIERADGPGLLIGPTGTGKTLLLSVLAEQFSKRFSVAVLTGGRITTRRALLQAILYELGRPYQGLDEGELRLALSDYLTRSMECPEGMLLLVDEAHTLPMRLLEELRMITNLMRGSQPRVRLVLAGGASLEEHFTHPKLDSFNQRVAARCYLETFDQAETADFLRFELAVAGGHGEVFTAEALRAVHRATDGIPRLINQLCDQALLRAFSDQSRQVDAGMIEQAWSDLQQLPTPWNEEATSDGSGVVEFGSLSDDEDLGVAALQAPPSEQYELDLDSWSDEDLPAVEFSEEVTDETAEAEDAEAASATEAETDASHFELDLSDEFDAELTDSSSEGIEAEPLAMDIHAAAETEPTVDESVDESVDEAADATAETEVFAEDFCEAEQACTEITDEETGKELAAEEVLASHADVTEEPAETCESEQETSFVATSGVALHGDDFSYEEEVLHDPYAALDATAHASTDQEQAEATAETDESVQFSFVEDHLAVVIDPYAGLFADDVEDDVQDEVAEAEMAETESTESELTEAGQASFARAEADDYTEEIVQHETVVETTISESVTEYTVTQRHTTITSEAHTGGADDVSSPPLQVTSLDTLEPQSTDDSNQMGQLLKLTAALDEAMDQIESYRQEIAEEVVRDPYAALDAKRTPAPELHAQKSQPSPTPADETTAEEVAELADEFTVDHSEDSPEDSLAFGDSELEANEEELSADFAEETAEFESEELADAEPARDARQGAENTLSLAEAILLRAQDTEDEFDDQTEEPAGEEFADGHLSQGTTWSIVGEDEAVDESAELAEDETAEAETGDETFATLGTEEDEWTATSELAQEAGEDFDQLEEVVDEAEDLVEDGMLTEDEAEDETDEQAEQPSYEASDDDVIVVEEEHETGDASTPATHPVRRQDYRQLFARLRRG